MKTFLILIMVFPVLCTAQPVNWFEKENFLFVSTEIDARNALFGSPVNPPAYDGVFNLGYRDHGFHVQASYENFKAIEFYSFGFKAGHVFNYEGDWNYTVLAGLGWIQRNVDWIQKTLHGSASISGQMEYHVHRFFLFLRGEGRVRTDINKFKPSGYAGIGFKI